MTTVGLIVCLVVACATEPRETVQGFADVSSLGLAGHDRLGLGPYVEMFRSAIRTNKVLIITKHLGLTEQEAAVFWPLYRDYERAWARLIDNDLLLLNQYLDVSGRLTNQAADSMSRQHFHNRDARLTLQKEYYEKFSEALSPLIAMKFEQIERQINLVMELELSSRVPIVLPAERTLP
jgi:hypothetical protein